MALPFRCKFPCLSISWDPSPKPALVDDISMEDVQLRLGSFVLGDVFDTVRLGPSVILTPSVSLQLKVT